MPWKGGAGFDGVKTHKKDMIREKVDQLPLVASSENVGDSESRSDSSSFVAHPKRRPRSEPHPTQTQTQSRHITTVSIKNNDDTTTSTDASPPPHKHHHQHHTHHQSSLKRHHNRHSAQPQQPQPNQDHHGLPIISYEKNKSVRIVVQKDDKELEGSSRGGAPPGGGTDRVYWSESFPPTKSQDISNWVANQGKAVDNGNPLLTSDKLKEEEGVKVRPFVETCWRSSSRASVLLDDQPSSDDCQRSTSTLVNTATKVGRTTSASQTGFVSVLCGISVVVGAAVCLRLPGLLLAYGPGTFLCAFFVCLLFVALPLAYLECGLAQFSNNSAIGIWSLVPLSRGIGWTTVVGCLYWGATTTGLAAPWFHYLVELNQPNILQVPDICMQSNGSEFDAVNYYRHCVYNLSHSSPWESSPDLSLTWSLPVGMVVILVFASVSVAGGPFLLAFISATGSLLALIGYGLQLYVSVAYLTDRNRTSTDLTPFIDLLTPDPNILIQPQVWLSALSQALLCLGSGVGMLLNHCANNAFRHPLKRHLWFLTTLTILSTLLVATTIICETKILSDHFSPLSNTSLSKNLLSDPSPLSNTSLSKISLLQFDVEGNESLSSYNDDFNRVKNEDQPCGLFPYNPLAICPSPDLLPGIAFIASSHLTSFALTLHPPWLTAFIANLVFIGFLGAGIASACVCMHVGVVAAREARSLPPPAAALILMAVLAVVAAPMSTQAGASLIHLVDQYVLTPGLLWPPVATLVALATCHGVVKIRKDMTFMLESVVAWVWLPLWALVLPLLFLGVTVWAFCVDWRDLCVVDGPVWRLSVVWSLRAALIISIPVTAIIVINSQLAYGFKDKVLSSLQSSREWGDWGPQDPIEHHNWRRWREDETRSYASLERRLASKSRPLTYTHSTLSSASSSTLAKLRAKYKGQAQHAVCDL